MSKIQEALGKIQGNRVPRSGTSRGEREEESTVVIAALEDRQEGDSSYEVSGRTLTVDREALRDAGLVAPDYHEQLLANQYRDIKRPLIATAYGKRATEVESGNLIMITSALAGEGKTFTSINLAISMAQERDYSVVLVDADVAKPRTSEMFGASEEPGLLDLLESPDRSLRSMLLATDIDRLSILPAGRPRAHATELLSSSAMENVCASLQNLSEKQLVVVDSPPLLQTSEGKVLADLAGQIVVVVRAEETSRDAVASALETLDSEKAINLVLNQARIGFGSYQYGYGYGYQSSYTSDSSSE